MVDPLLYFPNETEGREGYLRPGDAGILIAGIANAARKAGIYNGQVPLSGPQLLMLLDDMAEEIVRLNGGAVKKNGLPYPEEWFENNHVSFEGWTQFGESILKGGLITVMKTGNSKHERVGEIRIPPLKALNELNASDGNWSQITIDGTGKETVYYINGQLVTAQEHTAASKTNIASLEIVADRIVNLGLKPKKE